LDFKSLELCYVWIDEAQAWSEMAYHFVLARRRGTDRQRRLYPNMPLNLRITANPPHTMDHWLVDKCTKPLPETGKPAVRLISAATEDNPFLPAAYIQSLRRNYDPEVADIELGGKFGDIQRGRVWRRFNRGRHVLGETEARRRGLPALRPDPTLPLCLGQDFNIDPLCSVLFQWRRVRVNGYQEDVMYVLDEFYIRDSTIDLVAKELLNRGDLARIAKRNGILLYGDASGYQGNRQTGLSDWESLRMALADLGFSGTAKVPAANPDRTLRYKSGNRMLEDANGNLGVVIHERCVNLPLDLERMYFRPGTSIVEVPKIKDGKPVRLVTHLADAWSYPIVYEYPIAERHLASVSTIR